MARWRTAVTLEHVRDRVCVPPSRKVCRADNVACRVAKFIPDCAQRGAIDTVRAVRSQAR